MCMKRTMLHHSLNISSGLLESERKTEIAIRLLLTWSWAFSEPKEDGPKSEERPEKKKKKKRHDNERERERDKDKDRDRERDRERERQPPICFDSRPHPYNPHSIAIKVHSLIARVDAVVRPFLQFHGESSTRPKRYFRGLDMCRKKCLVALCLHYSKRASLFRIRAEVACAQGRLPICSTEYARTAWVHR